MMENNLYVLVVIYNVCCADSAACKGLSSLSNARTIIYDNSTRNYGNRDYCEKMNWQYLGGEGNRGLSVAYNTCIDHLQARGETGYLCLLDDDTMIDEHYFDALRAALRRHPDAGILVPRIFSGEKLLSPCLMKDARARSFASESEMLATPKRYWSAINSCMAVSLRLFEQYRYDEHIFLDGVDHQFLEDMRARGEYLTLIDYACNQAFSGHERPSKQAALTRFLIFARDEAYIHRRHRADYWRVVGRRALKLTVQYRTLLFLKAITQAAKSNRNNRRVP